MRSVSQLQVLCPISRNGRHGESLSSDNYRQGFTEELTGPLHRSRNMLLMAVNNGKERSEDEWIELVTQADSRLVWKLLQRGETMAVMEVTLQQ